MYISRREATAPPRIPYAALTRAQQGLHLQVLPTCPEGEGARHGDGLAHDRDSEV